MVEMGEDRYVIFFFHPVQKLAGDLLSGYILVVQYPVGGMSAFPGEGQVTGILLKFHAVSYAVPR